MREQKNAHKNKVILVVDDVADDILLTREVLEKEGYAVAEADNWCDAITVVGRGGIDLIVLDLKMPEMDGIKLLGIIREQNTCMELPVIIYSSLNNVNANDNMLKGSNAFVGKSSEPKILLEKIEEIFSVM